MFMCWRGPPSLVVVCSVGELNKLEANQTSARQTIDSSSSTAMDPSDYMRGNYSNPELSFLF